MSLLIGLDLGTTTIKAVLYDPEQGRVIESAARPTPVEHPPEHLDWSQHDPQALWEAVCACLRQVAQANQPTGLAISSFAEAGLPLDKAGQPLYPIIAWYDRRTMPQVEWWQRQVDLQVLHALTGQYLSPSFGVNKWLWLREHEPQRASRMVRWLSAPDYILFRLTGEQATDYTIASRTMLLDQQTRTWAPELLRRAGLGSGDLPPIYPSGTVVGQITPQAAAESGLPAGLPCALGGHDHLCGALAAGACRPGVVIDSIGTAEALLMVIPAFLNSPRLIEGSFACYTHVVPEQYVIKGGLKAAGKSIEWLARQLSGQPELPAGELPYAELEAAAWESYYNLHGKSAGPIWLPHLLGSGSPESDNLSRGALVGLRPDHGPGDLFRSLLESLAFWMRHNLEEIGRLTGQSTEKIVLLGGPTRLQLYNQLKANVLNQAVFLAELPEASATGAALLAGIGTGIFSSTAEAVASLRYTMKLIEPHPTYTQRYDELYRSFYLPLYQALKGIHHIMAKFD